jgi:S-formylglutathione hydrolase FrmB
MSTNIQVLAPDAGSGPYRIVYLLHGMHGDQGTWLDNTMLPIFAKKYNAIFVMPEVCRSFYADLKYGRKYYTFVAEELPKVCQKFFNISPKREDAAVIGCSMGGFGALFLALTRPDQFGFCGAISSACIPIKTILEGLRKDPQPWLNTGPEAVEIFTDLKSIYGEELGYRPEYDILELVKNFPGDKPKPKIYSACGTEDDLRKDNLNCRDIIKDTGFDFTYEEWAGDHEWFFFNEALKKTIEFWYK